jgi:hypothetical protein
VRVNKLAKIGAVATKVTFVSDATVLSAGRVIVAAEM